MHVVDFDHHGQTRTQRLCVCILNPVKKNASSQSNISSGWWASVAKIVSQHSQNLSHNEFVLLIAWHILLPRIRALLHSMIQRLLRRLQNNKQGRRPKIFPFSALPVRTTNSEKTRLDYFSED